MREAGYRKISSSGEKCPRENTSEIEKCIGIILLGHVEDYAKDETEEEHETQRLQNGPQNPDNGLLVTNQKLPPDKYEQQVLIAIKTLNHSYTFAYSYSR